MKNDHVKRQAEVDGFKRFVQRSIRVLRIERGWSQEQLAKKLNVDQSTISNYESGKTDMTYGQLFEMCLVFGKDLISLIEIHSRKTKGTSPDKEQEQE